MKTVDVVEAIDAWIDDRIDDLTDDELEQILQILDELSLSSFATLSKSEVVDADLDIMVTVVGGDRAQIAYTEYVLRSALFDEDGISPSEADFAADPDDTHTDDTDADITDTSELDGTDRTDADPEATQQMPVVDDPDLGDHHDPDLDTTELTDTDLDDIDTSDLAELTDADVHDIDTDLNQLTTKIDPEATQQMPVVDTTQQLRTVQPVELFPGDSLGPSFLTPPDATVAPTTSRRTWFPVAVAAFLIGGLALFGFGITRLVSSLGEDEVAAEATATAEPEEEAEPTPSPPPATATAAPAPAVGAAATAEPSPTPEPEPQASIAIRLATGDVALVTFESATSEPVVETIFDSTLDEFADATHVSWMGPRLAIFDANGDFYVYNVNRPNPVPRRLWEAGEGLAPAVGGVQVGDELAILTSEGDVTFMSGFVIAEPDELRLVWDADEEAVRATDIAVLSDLVPMVLENGDVKMIITSSDDLVSTIWSSEAQPPVFNISSTPSGFLMGVGQGAVASWLLLDDGPLVTAAWDPAGFNELPAIAYSDAGTRNAVVVADGAVILADDTGNGARVWDPVETELPAVGVDSDASQVILQLEAGSVVRIPMAAPEEIASVWDITDETLSPAVQVALEPLGR